MSSNNQNQKLSFKDKITSHLPGHKTQDNNANGVPDRLEKNSGSMNQQGYNQGLATGYPTGNLGTTMVPGTTQNTTTTSFTKDVNGLPFQGNLLNDRTITSSTISREPALIQTQNYQQPIVQPMVQHRQVIEPQGFGFVGTIQPNQNSMVDVREAPTMVEHIEKPTIIHEVYKTEEVIQIQPVINREREQLDVYEVVQPIREREVIATEVRQGTLAAQTRATIVEDNSAFLAQRSAPTDFSTREVAATMSQTVTNAPIIHETITHRVIEEVQPVIYKEIDRPVLIHETLPIYERLVEAPHVHHSSLPMRDLGTRSVATTTVHSGSTMYQTTGLQSGLHSQGMLSTQGGFNNDLNRNGIPDNLERQGSYGQQGFSQGGFNNDLNRNGIPDNLERQGLGQQGLVGQQYGQQGLVGQQQYGQQGLSGGLNDRNGNGIPDNLERQGAYGNQSFLPNPAANYAQSLGQGNFAQTGLQGGLNDRNGNGVPDNLERQGAYGQQGFSQGAGHRTLSDLNGNGVPDRMEKAHGLRDLNGNGVDDSVERRMGAASLNANNRV